MNRLFYTLLLTVLLTSTSTNTLADVVHQLAGVDAAGNAVVIEYTKSNHWEVVYEGFLDACSVEVSDQSNGPAPNTFHQPLGNGQFAFACPNGYVHIAENGKSVESVQLPTNYRLWYDKVAFIEDGEPGIFLQWKTSPAFMAFSKEFNDTFGKNWLFVAQKGNLFIIDIYTKELVAIEGWPNYLGFYNYSYLRMGSDLKDIDYTLPMAGFDIFRDKQDAFHLLGALGLPGDKAEKPQLLIQSLPLPNGIPEQQWEKPLNSIHVELEKDFFRYASDKFKCDTGKLPPQSKQHLPRICNWPDNLPVPPSPRELKGLTGSQPQLDHYHSYITFERTPDNTDYIVRKRTNENAFSREDL